MVTIAEAKQQIQQSNIALQRQREELERRRQQALSQESLRKQNIQGLKTRELQLGSLSSAQQRVEESQRNVKEYEQKVVDIENARAREYGETQTAIKLYIRSQQGKPVGLKGQPPGVVEKFKELESKYSESLDRQAYQTALLNQKLTTQNISPNIITPQLNQSIEQPTMSYASPEDYRMSIASPSDIKQMDIARPSDYQLQSIARPSDFKYELKETPLKISELKDIDKLQTRATEIREGAKRQIAAGGYQRAFGYIRQGGVGVAQGLVITPARIISNPFITGRAIVSGIKSFKENPKEITKAVAKEQFTLFKTEPTYAVSELGGSLFFGSVVGKGIEKGIDFTRTAGLSKVATTEVIAPEYFAGQTYPTIKKGQTAGELLEEFKPQFPGETKPAGFTAAAKPLKGSEFGAGSSELPGLYQAPKLSPAFLRLTKEQRSISLNPVQGLFTLRPSAFRITPTKYELVPKVNPSQSNMASLQTAKKFYETSAEKGTAYIPFIKTEKEAIIPAGTQFEQTGKRFYFKFEGRRVPVYEIKTLEVGQQGSKVIPEKVIASQSESLSYLANQPKYNVRELVYPLSSSQGLSKSEYIPSSINSNIKPSSSNLITGPSKPLPSSSIPSPSPSKRIQISSPSSPSSDITPLKISTGSYTSTSKRKLISPQKTSASTSTSKSIRKPRPRIPPGYIPKTSAELKKMLKPEVLKAFEVQVRRKGKFTTIGEDLPQGKALKLGAETVGKTLGATFRLKETGQTTAKDINFNLPSNKFTLPGPSSKLRAPLTYIEKPSYRLSTRSEVSEIQKSKSMGKLFK